MFKMRRRTTAVSVLLIHVCLGFGLECPRQSKDYTGVPYFTTKLTSDLIYVRYGHYAELDCCMEGTHEMIWTKLNTEKGTWDVFNIADTDANRIEFVNNRHSLVFKSVEFQDGGSYKCSPKQMGIVQANISRKFSVDVLSCDPLARGPYAIAPVPCEKTFCNIGKEITLPCNAYFGCNDDSDFRLVQWFVSRDDKEDSDWIPAAEFDPRYNVTLMKSGNGVEIHSNLTITRVNKEDMSRRFKCVLTSAQVVHGQTTLPVKLVTADNQFGQNEDVAMASVTITMVAAVGCGMVVVILIFISVTILQNRKTRQHISRDIEQKISIERLPLHIGDSKTYADDVIHVYKK